MAEHQSQNIDSNAAVIKSRHTQAGTPPPSGTAKKPESSPISVRTSPATNKSGTIGEGSDESAGHQSGSQESTQVMAGDTAGPEAGGVGQDGGGDAAMNDENGKQT